MWYLMNKFSFGDYGRVFIPIGIKPLDDITLSKVRFKVDTGADRTTISKASLLQIGYSMDWINKNAIIYKDENKPTTAMSSNCNSRSPIYRNLW